MSKPSVRCTDCNMARPEKGDEIIFCALDLLKGRPHTARVAWLYRTCENYKERQERK